MSAAPGLQSYTCLLDGLINVRAHITFQAVITFRCVLVGRVSIAPPCVNKWAHFCTCSRVGTIERAGLNAVSILFHAEGLCAQRCRRVQDWHSIGASPIWDFFGFVYYLIQPHADPSGSNRFAVQYRRQTVERRKAQAQRWLQRSPYGIHNSTLPGESPSF
jgi:hypothetical protein